MRCAQGVSRRRVHNHGTILPVCHGTSHCKNSSCPPCSVQKSWLFSSWQRPGAHGRISSSIPRTEASPCSEPSPILAWFGSRRLLSFPQVKSYTWRERSSTPLKTFKRLWLTSWKRYPVNRFPTQWKKWKPVQNCAFNRTVPILNKCFVKFWILLFFHPFRYNNFLLKDKNILRNHILGSWQSTW